MTDEHEPGIYLVNATGEMTALATESGDVDRKLLVEALEQQLSGPERVELANIIEGPNERA